MTRGEFEQLIRNATAGMSESQKAVMRQAMEERYAERLAEQGGTDRWGGTKPPTI